MIWNKIKNYKRDFLMGAVKGYSKGFTVEDWNREGKKLGLKPTTLELKLSRLIREEKIKVGENGIMMVK